MHRLQHNISLHNNCNTDLITYATFLFVVKVPSTHQKQIIKNTSVLSPFSNIHGWLKDSLLLSKQMIEYLELKLVKHVYIRLLELNWVEHDLIYKPQQFDFSPSLLVQY